MKRKEARENAFLLLFEATLKPSDSAEEIFENAVSERELEADSYVKDVFFGFDLYKEELDSLIDECLVGWKRNRVSYVAMAILRLGAYEMKYLSDIPALVTINEGVELAKKYDDEKSYSFVNGVLNALAEKTGKKNAK